MKKLSIVSILVLLIVPFIFGCGTTNSPKELKAVPDDCVGDSCGDNPAAGDDDVTFHNLFALEAGTRVSFSSYNGAVDPTGTTIVEDFDGDGIINSRESTTNVWVADYPNIETNIATPVTMKIEILETSEQESSSITSEISSDDVVDKSKNSSDVSHLNELNLKTVQFQDTYSATKKRANSQEEANSQNSSYGQSSTTKRSESNTRKDAWNANAGFKIFSAGGGKSSERSNSSSSEDSSSSNHSQGTSNSSKFSQSMEDTYSDTVTDWKDIPFKNNTGKNGWSLDRGRASVKSRKARSEFTEKSTNGIKITSNAGYIRAALYIKNTSVNMPVKLSNILCSFMFETPGGQLIPVQSFRLKNNDYSDFSIEIYGNSTFGPYVVELTNLNTAEIKEALVKGYNPKIFIIDYRMEHVEDSNYRQALSSSFSGNNLKIIEENAKGRTSAIKIIGPGIRQFARVAAFDTDIEEKLNTTTEELSNANVSPGVSLEKALKRISFSGIPIETADYVIDFGGLNPPIKETKFFIRGIKSINGKQTTFPISQIVEENNRNIYIVKPVSEWTEDELRNFRLWTVYDKGKYYFHSGDEKDESGNFQTFTYTDLNGKEQIVNKQLGIKSLIWPGDHYDIVYLDLNEFTGYVEQFGNNPIESEETFVMNTRWDLDELGEHPFYPDANSKYLGEVNPGEIIEIEVNLKNSRYINPDFGEKIDNIYSNFNYDILDSTEKFYFEEVIDFEINLGTSGKFTDWINILTDLDDSKNRSPYIDPEYFDSDNKSKIEVIDKTWNFMDQIFKIELKIPKISGVGNNEPVKLYFRTALNNAYRVSVWPLNYRDVKQFRGIVAENIKEGSSSFNIKFPIGTIEIGNRISIKSNGVRTAYFVKSINENQDIITVEVTDQTQVFHQNGDIVYVDLVKQLNGPQIKLKCDNDFSTVWNNQWLSDLGITAPLTSGDWEIIVDQVDEDKKNTFPLLEAEESSTESIFQNPSSFLGFDTKPEVMNWLGGYNHNNPYVNNWSDASFFRKLFVDGFFPSLKANDGSFFGMIADYLIKLTDEEQKNTSQIGVMDSDVHRSQFTVHKTAKTLNKALLIWSSDDLNRNYTLYGRVTDISNGTTVGDQIVLGTMTDKLSEVTDDGLGTTIRTYSADNNILVTWETIDRINETVRLKYRVIDTSTGSARGVSDTDIGANGLTTNRDVLFDPVGALNRNVVINGNRAIIVWDDGATGDIHSKVINLETGLFLSDDPEIVSSNSTNSQNGIQQVKIYNNRTFVVWVSSDVDLDDMSTANSDINMQEIDSNTGEAVGSTISLATTTSSDYNQFPHIEFYNDKAIVQWQNYKHFMFGFGIDASVYINFVDLNGQISRKGEEIKINTASADLSLYCIMKVNGDKAIISWIEANFSEISEDNNGLLHARAIDLENETALNNRDLIVSNNNVKLFNFPFTANYDNKAILVYSENNTLVAKFINLETGYFTDSRGILLGNSDSNTLSSISIGDKAIFTWKDEEQVKCTIANISEEKIIGKAGFNVGAITNYSYSNRRNKPYLLNVNDKALITWASNSSEECSIIGRVIDINNGAPMDLLETLISDSSNLYHYDPQGIAFGERVYFSYFTQTQDSQNKFANIFSKIIKIPDQNNLLNNFFIAPLVERTYEVKVKIVEDDYNFQ